MPLTLPYLKQLEGRPMSRTDEKFTPGPWRCLPSSKSSGWFQIFGDHPGKKGTFPAWVASCRATELSDSHNRANAHLIAAAPELFDAAECALEWLDNDDTDPTALKAQLRAALAKARGEQ